MPLQTRLIRPLLVDTNFKIILIVGLATVDPGNMALSYDLMERESVMQDFCEARLVIQGFTFVTEMPMGILGSLHHPTHLCSILYSLLMLVRRCRWLLMSVRRS